MIHDTHGHHHLHRRKRIHAKHEKYPHPNRRKRIVDKTVYIAGFFGLGMTIHQVMKIWVEKNAAGISVISWASYLIVALVWIFYGFEHKEKPIVMVYSLWIIFHILIITGSLIYA